MQKLDYDTSSPANCPRTRTRQLVAAISILLCLTAITILFPYIPFAAYSSPPATVGLMLFAAPQQSLAFLQVIHPSYYPPSYGSSPSSTIIFAVLLWGSTTILYARIARRLPVWAILAAAPLAILIVIAIVHLALGVLGHQIDTP